MTDIKRFIINLQLVSPEGKEINKRVTMSGENVMVCDYDLDAVVECLREAFLEDYPEYWKKDQHGRLVYMWYSKGEEKKE
jgi:hypothetical protein